MGTIKNYLVKESVTTADVIEYLKDELISLPKVKALPLRDKTSPRYERDNDTIDSGVREIENLIKKLEYNEKLSNDEKIFFLGLLNHALRTVTILWGLDGSGLEKYIKKIDLNGQLLRYTSD